MGLDLKTNKQSTIYKHGSVVCISFTSKV